MVDVPSIEQAPSLADNSLPYLAVLGLVALGGVHHWQGWLAGLDVALPLVPLFIMARQSDSQALPFLVLLAGLFKDILSGTPFGFWGLLFCLFYFMIHSARYMLAAQEDREQWLAFAGNVGLVYFVAYIVALIHIDITPAPLLTFLSALITMLAYPLVLVLFDDVHLLNDER